GPAERRVLLVDDDEVEADRSEYRVVGSLTNVPNSGSRARSLFLNCVKGGLMPVSLLASITGNCLTQRMAEVRMKSDYFSSRNVRNARFRRRLSRAKSAAAPVACMGLLALFPDGMTGD